MTDWQINKRIISIAILLILIMVGTAYGIPVFPGAKGYGVETPAGRGGQIIRVTNLNASGSGSLKEAIKTEGPRIVNLKFQEIFTLMIA